ncbi:MAG: sulfatase-like hydrolase/transferase [bacterium]|nr:sulfatase-like hydrolase/transferase [bacterium]
MLALLAACLLAAQEPAPRPNVLFLFADDQRPDAVGAFGNEHIETPNLDALAGRGFRFARNYCMGSIHGAVCQPSRAMLMTGRSLYRVSMQLKDETTLPELLGTNGYVTFGTGKWHNGGPSFLRSFQRGTNVMLGGMSDHTAVPVVDVTDDHTLSEKRTGAKFSSELFADSAIEFIEGHEGEQPFFCYVAFTAPHDPRQPPERLREHYYANRPPLPANFLPQHPFHNGRMVGRDEKLAGWPRTEAVISDQLAEYYGLITHMDEQIGRVLAALETSGHADNTIVVYAADHGLAMGSHGLLGKQSVYEHSMGCPLVFAGPGVPGGKSAALTYLFDIFPTLCELIGVEPPAGVEGQSLVPVWRGEHPGVRDTLFLTYENLMRAVRDDRYKLIRYPRIDHTQLFDLERDPAEMHDLAREPEHAERVESMMALLRTWQERTNDPHPLEIDEPESMEIDLSGRARKPDRWQPEWIVKKYFGND